MKYRRLIPLPVLAALLGACGDDGAPQEGQVTGEVLEGSISDEMLPLDQVRSEAPLADPTASARSGGTAGSTSETESAGEDDTDAQEPQPAEPAAEAD